MRGALQQNSPPCPVCGSGSTAAGRSGGAEPCSQCGHLHWFRIQEFDNTVVINVSSKLDLEASDIRRVGELVLHRHPAATIIVNLALVEYIGSTFLDRLVLLKKRVQAARGRLILCGFNSVIQEVFRITRLDGFFEITDEAPPRRKDA